LHTPDRQRHAAVEPSASHDGVLGYHTNHFLTIVCTMTPVSDSSTTTRMTSTQKCLVERICGQAEIKVVTTEGFGGYICANCSLVWWCCTHRRHQAVNLYVVGLQLFGDVIHLCAEGHTPHQTAALFLGWYSKGAAPYFFADGIDQDVLVVQILSHRCCQLPQCAKALLNVAEGLILLGLADIPLLLRCT
jgi:hypothetical protein